MKEIVATVTERGQVTVPAEVRRLLGTGPHDKLVFVIDGEQVSLKRPAFTLETAFASVKPLGNEGDFKRIIREAKEERAERAVRELNEQ
jgi:antitoxin PrlF